MIAFTLLLHVAATLYMTGVIWFVQTVHYPLFAKVGDPGFVAYQAGHLRFTAYVVVPGMLLELGTGILLLPVAPPEIRGLLWLGLALLAVVWISTFLLQVPQHRRLERGFDAEAWSRLVRTNWVRTAAWSARALVVGIAAYRYAEGGGA